MPVNFAETRKQAEDAGLIGSGDYFKFKEGPNRLRLLSECLPHPGEFKGTKNFKWLAYVLDRRDGKVKPFFMPHTVYKAIEALQMSEDYAFFDVPMPYDITVHADGAGTKEVKYSVMPAKKEIPLTASELNDLKQAKPLAELQRILKDKREKQAAQAADEHDFNPRDLEDDNGDPELNG